MSVLVVAKLCHDRVTSGVDHRRSSPYGGSFYRIGLLVAGPGSGVQFIIMALLSLVFYIPSSLPSYFDFSFPYHIFLHSSDTPCFVPT